MIIDLADFQRNIGVCKHCNQKGVILQAVNSNEEACWDCVRSFKVVNPTGLGWC